MTTVEIKVTRELFRFHSQQEWVNKARSWYASCGVPKGMYITVDANGHIMHRGQCFEAATAANAYPVTVYELATNWEYRPDPAPVTASADDGTHDPLQAAHRPGIEPQRSEPGALAVGPGVLVGRATGWAWAQNHDAKEWSGDFSTRAEAVGELLAAHPLGGWVCQTRDVTADDQCPAGEDWTFVCVPGTAEFVSR
ncbi:hypothetical protein E4T66_17525 [Sinimarinibacterium sp. CAU 1509]|uniref:hypothetical protein n=1 Tax=Sinimarinibacterium sp. CAU 1509 TaxID=2562283 RepID=UPI0010AC2AFD|nr:hypothetical protein [Sinimarinibacterium sp. CAU 1509]TJY57209.1 hypothetical protein E4T66_17525 [Sinimarinibacterium sp. CAU 1509]